MLFMYLPFEGHLVMLALVLYVSIFSTAKSFYADPSCMYEYNGASYTASLNITGKGSDCLGWTDPVVPVYPAESFPDGDTGHNYCRNPKTQGGHARKPWCFVSTSGGVTFQYCEEIKLCDCPTGHFGPGCRKKCGCRDTNETCSHVTGSCNSGCAIGWAGTDCQRRCPSGRFGFNCGKRCFNCFKSSCEPETGNCHDGCEPGFKGDNCSQECPSGQYGRNCDGQCGNCSNNEPCHWATGRCLVGCAPGYVGDTCQQWCNETDPYGEVCVKRCHNCNKKMTCDTSTGRCVQDGNSKEVRTPFPRKYVMIAIGSACAVVVIIALIGCFVLKRTRDASVARHEKDVLHEFYLENYRRMESLDVPEPVQPEPETEKIYTLIEVRERHETSI